jgi:cytosine/adenosine deaminase-related metal-dependent hydrolase
VSEPASPAPAEILVDAAWVGERWIGPLRIVVEGATIREIDPLARAPGQGVFALPAFANAHVHLDLTPIQIDPPEAPGFATWIEELLRRRRDLEVEVIHAGIRAGVRGLQRTGTTAVGDIDSMGHSLPILRELDVEGVCYRELIGVPGDAVWKQVGEIARATPQDASLRLGLSPHAPYSTPEQTYRRAFELCASLGLALASHVAETREESEYLQSGGGSLGDLFARFGFARPAWDRAQRGSLERVLDTAEPAVAFAAIHANHPDATDLDGLVRRRASVVYCPRSHEYFGHPPEHPAARYLAAGIPVALGTDSRASNEGLDMWQEMACCRRRCPSLEDRQILWMATGAGRAVLRLEEARLRPGDPATLQLVESADGRRIEPERLTSAAVRGELRTVQTLRDGHLICVT